MSAKDLQEGGSHYKDMKIQPFEFIHANNIPFAEGCAIKYLCRWRKKGGVEDLKKAIHFIELLIDAEKPWEPEKAEEIINTDPFLRTGWVNGGKSEISENPYHRKFSVEEGR